MAERSTREEVFARQVMHCAGEAYVVVAAVVAIASVATQRNGMRTSVAAAMLVPVVLGFAVAALRSGRRALRMARTRSVRASVERALAALGPDYCVLARLAVSPGREDHVAIGPNGVFVVVACDEPGRVTASSRRLFVNARLPWRDLVDDTRMDALRVRERVRRALGQHLPVHSVLCFARALVAVGQEIQGVKIVHTSRLARLIASTPVATPLAPADVRAAAVALTEGADSAAARPVRRLVPILRPAPRATRRLMVVGRSSARQESRDRSA